MRCTHAVFALPLVLIACGGRLAESGDADGGTTGSADGGASEGADAASVTALDAGAPPIVLDAGVPPVECQVPATVHGGDMGTCATPDGTRNPQSSTADVFARLAGSWVSCGGSIQQPADAIGFSIDDNLISFLVRGANNQPAVGVGSSYGGYFSIVDDTSTNGPGPRQFELDMLDNGAVINRYFVESFDQPLKLVLTDATSGNAGEYTPACAVPGTEVASDAGPRPDAGAAGAAACSLVGTWDEVSTPSGGAWSFLFSSDGTFVGGAQSAPLPSGQTFSGAWSLDGAGRLVVSNTTGMECNQGPTTMSVAYGADCATATLEGFEDACTGARTQLGGPTVMVRR